jgi:hypothetical protein
VRLEEGALLPYLLKLPQPISRRGGLGAFKNRIYAERKPIVFKLLLSTI